MNRGKDRNPIKIQRSLSPDLTADAEPVSLPFEDVIEITSNVCMEKDICGACGRGDHYGIPLHFLLHYPDGALRTVCFTCGKKAAGKTGLKLPPTESGIFAREEEADLRIIRIARKKIEAKNERTNI
jgi:hypothetical protein